MTSWQHRAIVAWARGTGRNRRYRSRAALEHAIAADRRRRPVRVRRLGQDIRVTVDESYGFPVHTLTPAGADPAHTMLYVHGGGYVFGPARQHYTFAAAIARLTGRPMVVPRYPLAPEHTWTHSFEALVHLARPADGSAPVLLGDSAGGGYALALAARLGHEGRRPSCVLVAPWVDVALDISPSPDLARWDPWLATPGALVAGEMWSSGSPRLPETSPINADLSGIARVLVFAGTRDILYPQCAALARSLGDRCQLVTGEALLHDYPLMPIPEARHALAETVSFIKSLT